MKYFVLVFCCCLLSGTAPAQQLVGIKGGWGLHNIRAVPSIRNVPLPEQNWVQGLGGGLIFRTLSSKHLGLQLELLLDQKGWHLLPATPNAYRIEEQHLTLPVQSVVMVGKGNFQLVINGGAFVSYIIGEKITEFGSPDGYPVKFRGQPNLDWHYGLLGGMGPAIRIGRSWLQLEGRFSYTLSNRLQPNLSVNDAFNITNQQSVSFALLWITQLGSSNNTK